MRGRQVFMDSLVAHGVDAIFGNPGTTENPLLDSLVDYPDITYYVALHESVAVCAAAFCAQASGRPTVASVHVAPGLGNAIGMMYGALKACAPVVITAGQQDTRMRLREPILSHDLVAMARPVTKWAAEPQHADEIGPIMRRAFQIAQQHPPGPVFVALPVNVMEQETTIAAAASGECYVDSVAPAAAIEHLAELLLTSQNPAVVAGDDVGRQDANAALAALTELTGASVYVEFLRAQLAMNHSDANWRGRLPIDTAALRRVFESHDLVLLIGGPFFEEVWFDDVEVFQEDTVVAQLEPSPERLARNFTLAAGVVGHLPTTLDALVTHVRQVRTAAQATAADTRNEALRELRAKEAATFEAQLRAEEDHQPMTAAVALATVANALPENATIVDEAITAGNELNRLFRLEHAGDYFAERGGGIGQGIAGALGVAVAQPGRKIVAITGDGSAMYCIQSLWTAAHHELDVLFVVLSNREYRVLKHNIDIYRQRFGCPPDKPYPHMDLGRPTLGFCDLAAGMGVPAREVTTPAELQAALDEALTSSGPFLLDVVIAGK